MIVYKWTREDLTTWGEYQYAVGRPAVALGIGNLCSGGWLHAYPDPLLAVLMKLAHVNDDYTVLWRCETSGKINMGRDKLGCTHLTLIERIDPPIVTIEQRIRFAILCAREVYQDPDWRTWADRWLDGSDRSTNAAAEAADSAWEADRAEEADGEVDWVDWEKGSAESVGAWAADVAANYASPHRTMWKITSTAGTAEKAARHSPIDLITLAYRAVAEE